MKLIAALLPLLTLAGCALIPPDKIERPQAVVRVYDVRDLLQPITDFGVAGTAPTTTPSSADRAARLIDVARIYAPGLIINAAEGTLIATGEPAAQEKLSGLLERARRERSVQVTIETRFLIVPQTTIAGLDADLREAIGAASVLTAAGAAEGRTTGTPFLDATSVTRLLRATQTQASSNLITAPRVTVFSGQQAVMTISTQQAYVADYAKDPAGALQPVIAATDSGVELRVRATASPDRKYIALDLHPRLSFLLGMARQPFTRILTTQKLEVHKPDLEVIDFRATAAVPDGGTIIVGAVPVRATVEDEQGVPNLSKAPLTKRLFTGRAAEGSDLLIILAKPQVLPPS